MSTKEILNEIYMIDPTLKNHDKDLEKIITTLTNQKPEVVIDQVFIKSLKDKIMKEEIKKEIEKDEVIAMEKLSTFSMSNLVYSGVGALVMLLIMIPFLMPKTGENKQASNNQVNTAQIKNKITNLGGQAFGSLTKQASNQDGSAKPESAVAAPSIAMGSAKAIPANDALAARAVGMGGGGANASFLSADSKMIAPNYQNYKYKYVGEELILDAKEAEVFKRSKSSGFDIAVDNILSSIGSTPVSLDKLVSPELQSLSISENKDFGLQINVNAIEGTIDFNQNWLKWQEKYPKCSDDTCFEQNRMKIGDMPSDEVAIALANDFITNYGLDLSGYGPGEIHNYWRQQYEESSDKNTFYIPEDIQVVYPLQVNGQTVYDTSGNPFGLNVNVNVKFMKVSSMYSIRTNNFESSNYALETDKDRIVKMAEKGGASPIYYMGERASEETKPDTELIELGTPKKVLLSYWYYDEKKQESSELFVPALVFPVTKKPADAQYFYQENVVIPLVKEILDTYENNFGGPVQMPMMKGAEGEVSPTTSIDNVSPRTLE